MTTEQISTDIERGLLIIDKIANLKTEQKAIETRLKQAAQDAPHIPLEDENREGKQALLESGQHTIPVRFTSDAIVGSFPLDSPAHKEILGIVGKDKFPLFFKEVHQFNRAPKDGLKFRQIGRENLDPPIFAKLIRAATARGKDGIAKSFIFIAWDDAKESTGAPTH